MTLFQPQRDLGTYLVPRAEFVDLTTTNETTMYTAASQFAIVHKVHVANTTGSAANITISIQDASESTKFDWITAKPVPANDVLDFDLEFNLAQDDEVRVTAGTGNALHVGLTLTELAGRLG